MSVSESTAAQLSAGRTMHALRLHERGGTEQSAYDTAPVRSIGIGDALVRIHAASITPTELGWPPTWEDRAGRDRRPVIPAHEVAGTVTALGYGTTGLNVGTAVYDLTDWHLDGAAADYIAVEVRDLALMPASPSFVEVAAVPLAGLTAWQTLFDHGGLSGGQTVLIHGAGGGVGTFAVQLAHVAGAHRGHRAGVGTAAPTQLGADDYIDLERQSFEDVAGAVDLVLDFVGGDILRCSWAVVKPGVRSSRRFKTQRPPLPQVLCHRGRAVSSLSSRLTALSWSRSRTGSRRAGCRRSLAGWCRWLRAAWPSRPSTEVACLAR